MNSIETIYLRGMEAVLKLCKVSAPYRLVRWLISKSTALLPDDPSSIPEST